MDKVLMSQISDSEVYDTDLFLLFCSQDCKAERMELLSFVAQLYTLWCCTAIDSMAAWMHDWWHHHCCHLCLVFVQSHNDFLEWQ